MTLEERKDNTYYDQTGKQILEGDLLRVFHFRTKAKIYYMYHVVVMDETFDFPVLSCKAHYADAPHYKLLALVNKNRVYESAKIIAEHDWEAKRKKIEIN